MAAPATERVIVVRNSREEPLLTGRPRLTSSDSPWKGIVLERHTVGSVEVPEHDHGSLCMHLQLRGDVEMEWWSEGRNAIEQPRAGSMILLPEGTRDRLRWEGTSERLIVSVTPAVMKKAAEEAGLNTSPHVAMQWHLHDEGLRALLAEMGREAEAGWPAGSLYGELLGMSLAQTLLRRHATSSVTLKDLRGGIPLVRLRRVLEWIEFHLHTDVRLEQLAAEAQLSPFHFARLFRESTGITPHQYVLERRMERAKTLLKLGKLTVAEVAQDAGFSSATNFVRAFRERIGVTPGDWSRAN
ncbi:AraC family transcriptional regulator [Terriglobus roseus]|uniref:AraC family transcriptional regulator n=1 Tax=Terriglobus roseus TaxID=392734 RepID=A0A1G7L0A7_9BACT|nr:AraC family transcriptional regulator [Terriglobus roseus]SDF42540.1 AraC family transcriptional regulator [Terriglobus roseus]